MTGLAMQILEVPATSTLGQLGFALRRAVFVEEQHVPAELEFDALDRSATHLVAIVSGEAVGVLRIVFLEGHAKIGRVAVAVQARRRGIGRAMMDAAIHVCSGRGQARMYLTAQTAVIAFYEKLGFVAFGEEFDDAGIPHYAMKTY